MARARGSSGRAMGKAETMTNVSEILCPPDLVSGSTVTRSRHLRCCDTCACKHGGVGAQGLGGLRLQASRAEPAVMAGGKPTSKLLACEIDGPNLVARRSWTLCFAGASVPYGAPV